jgi:hypothetical protein
VLFVIEGRVVLNGFVAGLNQVFNALFRRPIGLDISFYLPHLLHYHFYLILLQGFCTQYFTLHNLAPPLVVLADSQIHLGQILLDESNAIIAVVHADCKSPWGDVIYLLSKLEGYALLDRQIPPYLLQRWQSCPSNQPSIVFNFRI